MQIAFEESISGPHVEFTAEELEFQRNYCEDESDSDDIDSDSESSDSEDSDAESTVEDEPEDPVQFDQQMNDVCSRLCPKQPCSVPLKNMRRSRRSRRKLVNLQVLASQYENETDDEEESDVDSD